MRDAGMRDARTEERVFSSSLSSPTRIFTLVRDPLKIRIQPERHAKIRTFLQSVYF